MTTTRKPAVPLGVPALLGVGGFAAVLATSGETWQLAVSAALGALLVGVDIYRAARAS